MQIKVNYGHTKILYSPNQITIYIANDLNLTPRKALYTNEMQQNNLKS